VSKNHPVSYSSDRTDTNGLEQFFDDKVTSDSSNSSHKRTLEVSISEAARLLDISERTVWRKINSGKLKSKTKDNKRLVKVPVFAVTSNVSDSHTTVCDIHTDTNATVDLNTLLRDLQGANYRIGYLESENKRYSEQVKLLPDLQTKAYKAASQEDTITALTEELTRFKKSWWYRLYAFVNRL
jgi:hypothetical protein